MLFHLAEPSALLGILLALVTGLYARDSAQVLAARLARDPQPWRAGRLTTSIKNRLSPFSAVAMIIAGYGWAETIPMNDVWRKRRFHVATAILAGPLAYLLLTYLSLLAYRVASEPLVILQGNRQLEVRDGGGFLAEMLAWMAITFAAMFIISLVPVPPTDGGRVLFLLGPQSPSWRNAHLALLEKNIGVVILLVVILLPVLFPSFPSVAGQLTRPLLDGLAVLAGL